MRIKLGLTPDLVRTHLFTEEEPETQNGGRDGVTWWQNWARRGAF